MALISVKGGNKRQRALIQNVAYFCAYKLMSKRLANNICVEFELTDLGNNQYSGFCSWEDDNIRPREFNIELHQWVDDQELIATVCHEMVHVKQYAKEELKERFRFGYEERWYNQVVVREENDANYEELPWEVEAYDMQGKLSDEYIRSR